MILYFGHQLSTAVLRQSSLPMQRARNDNHAELILLMRADRQRAPLHLADPGYPRITRFFRFPQADTTGRLLVWHRRDRDVIPGIGSRPDERWTLDSGNQVVREKWRFDDSELAEYREDFEAEFHTLIAGRRSTVRMCTVCLMPLSPADVCYCCRLAPNRVARIVRL